MALPLSVSDWLADLRDANASDAQQAIANRYFQKLADVARSRIPAAARRTTDEEDVALSTLNSFFVATREGRYPNLRDRTDLWSLLLRITICKSINLAEREFAAKRGSGQVRGDSALAAAPGGFDLFASGDPTPESIAELQEIIESLMDRLENERLREIAQLRLAGHTNREIADALQCAERTIERKLVRIRHHWSLLAGDSEQ